MFATQTTAKATLRSKVEANADKRPALFYGTHRLWTNNGVKPRP